MDNVNGAIIRWLAVPLLSVTTRAVANDWPQACYNETSMWVTNACKEYIETVYYAAPGPDFASGLTGLLVIMFAIGVVLVKRRMRGDAESN